jgi:hypothetical protein
VTTPKHPDGADDMDFYDDVADDAFDLGLDALYAEAYSEAPAPIEPFDDSLTWPAPNEIADYEAEQAQAKAAADRRRRERRGEE